MTNKKRLTPKQKSRTGKSNKPPSQPRCDLNHPHADRCDGLHQAVDQRFQADLDILTDFYSQHHSGRVDQHRALDVIKECAGNVAWKCKQPKQ